MDLLDKNLHDKWVYQCINIITVYTFDVYTIFANIYIYILCITFQKAYNQKQQFA